MSTFSELFAGAVLPSEQQYILRSATWTAPANGYVRVVAASGGGGGVGGATGGGGGASELRGWQWKAITAGQQITCTIGAGGASGSAGGTTTVTAPWGSLTPAAGGASGAASGGTGGTGGDFAYPGGHGGVGLLSGGGALNPFNLLPAEVSGSGGGAASNGNGGGVLSAAGTGGGSAGLGQAPSGWMSFICGGGGEKKPGSGGSTSSASTAPGGLGAGAANLAGVSGGAGFALLEFARRA